MFLAIKDRRATTSSITPDTSVYITGHKRGVTQAIKRGLKPCTIVEPVIDYGKNDGLMDRNHLAGRTGDRINTTIAAAVYNLSQILPFLRILRFFITASLREPIPKPQNYAKLKMVFQGVIIYVLL